MDLRVYGVLARLAFRRQLAYRTANLAGLVANAFFGVLRASVLVAVLASAPGGSIAGYDTAAMVTYMWVVQALIMIVRLWGWWEVEETIRSGDVVTDLARPIPYLGYWLARDAQGRGLITRGVAAMLDHAFGPWRLHRVEIRAAPDNARSRAVPERLGFTLEGRLRDAERHPGGFRDLVVYALLAPDWRRAPR